MPAPLQETDQGKLRLVDKDGVTSLEAPTAEIGFLSTGNNKNHVLLSIDEDNLPMTLQNVGMTPQGAMKFISTEDVPLNIKNPSVDNITTLQYSGTVDSVITLPAPPGEILLLTMDSAGQISSLGAPKPANVAARNETNSFTQVCTFAGGLNVESGGVTLSLAHAASAPYTLGLPSAPPAANDSLLLMDSSGQQKASAVVATDLARLSQANAFQGYVTASAGAFSSYLNVPAHATGNAGKIILDDTHALYVQDNAGVKTLHVDSGTNEVALTSHGVDRLSTTTTGVLVSGQLTTEMLTCSKASGTGLSVAADASVAGSLQVLTGATLYHSGSQKFTTDTSGTTTTGTANINGGTGFAVIEMGGDSGAFIDMKAPAGDDHDVRLRTYGDGQFAISGYGGSGTSAGTMANFHYTGAVELFHDNSKKLETTASGVSVTGTAGMNTLQLKDNTTNSITLSAPAIAASSYDITLPSQQGAAQSVLENNGAGGLMWKLTATIMPVGAIIPYAGSSAPTGFFLCNGDQVSRSTYSVLYAVIGISYGDGDGSTTYHLPDMRGRFLRGVDGSAGRDPDKDNRSPSQAGGNGGNNIGSVQGYEVQGHTHTYLDMNPNSKVEVDNPDTFGGTEFPYDTETNATRTTNSTGGNETRPVNIYVNYIIRH